jgi:hypothetical protein
VLDALVRLQLADDNDLLAGWVSAKRFHLIRAATAAVAPSPRGVVSAVPPASGAPVQASVTSSAAA